MAQRNYKATLCTTDGDPSLEQTHVLMAEQHMTDGIICLSYNTKLQVPEGVPLVSIDRMERIAETCVDLVLDEHPEKAPSLICLPVSYAYGGTTRR